MLKRPRRNRKHESIRSLVQEHYLMPQDLVVPFFIIEGSQQKEAIPLMPQIFKMSADLALKEAEALHKKGIQSIALFPVYQAGWKDQSGSLALDPNGIIPQTLALFKKEIPSLCLIAAPPTRCRCCL